MDKGFWAIMKRNLVDFFKLFDKDFLNLLSGMLLICFAGLSIMLLGVYLMEAYNNIVALFITFPLGFGLTAWLTISFLEWCDERSGERR